MENVRNRISEIFTSDVNEELKNNCLFSINDVKMCMPVKVGDYTDFYSSRQHAFNVGCMFRDLIMPYYPIGCTFLLDTMEELHL